MLNFVTLDVFTETPFAGNPLAVVLGADGLSDAAMQVVAQEFNLSETIFVMASRDPAHTARVRIFFPVGEIPFAGHPTIGCAIHLACDGREGDFETLITLEEEAGLVPVVVSRKGDSIRAEFTAPVIPHAATGEAPLELAAAAVDLPVARIGFDAHRPGVWQGGPAFLYIPVAGLEALGAARPMEPHWSALMKVAGVDGAYVYTKGDDCDYRARMFSPTAGIAEDPATGSASAILAAALLEAGVLAEGETRLTLHQGVEMGRASRIGLRVMRDQGQITAVRVAGSAVPISRGTVRRP